MDRGEGVWGMQLIATGKRCKYNWCYVKKRISSYMYAIPFYIIKQSSIAHPLKSVSCNLVQVWRLYMLLAVWSLMDQFDHMLYLCDRLFPSSNLDCLEMEGLDMKLTIGSSSECYLTTTRLAQTYIARTSKSLKYPTTARLAAGYKPKWELKLNLTTWWNPKATFELIHMAVRSLSYSYV